MVHRFQKIYNKYGDVPFFHMEHGWRTPTEDAKRIVKRMKKRGIKSFVREVGIGDAEIFIEKGKMTKANKIIGNYYEKGEAIYG